MKTKMTATLAVAVVAVMVFAAAGSTTYSWFSDSDETDIDVSTAIVKMDTTFSGAGVNTDGVLSNVIPGMDYTINAVYSDNESTIETMHMLKAIITGPVTPDMSSNITLDGRNLPVTAARSTSTMVITGWTSLEAYEEPESKTLVLSVSPNLGNDSMGQTFNIQLVSELYQANAISQRVPIPDNGIVNTQIMNENGEDVPVIISGLSNIEGAAKVSVVEGFRAGTMVLDFNLFKADGTPITSFGSDVTITVKTSCPVFVVYDGEGAQPGNQTCEPGNDGTYTVTFTTNHFSSFILNPAFAMSGDKCYLTLADAIGAASGDDTITLLGDHIGAGAVIDKDVTIDFAGFTYSFNKGVGSTGTETNGFQIMKGNDVVLKNGTLTVAKEYADKFYILIQNYANLTIDGMTLDGTYLDKYSLTDGDSYVSSNNSGNVIIKGSTILANDDGDLAFAFDVCDKSAWGYDLPTVTVTDSIIKGKIEAVASIGDVDHTTEVYYATMADADRCLKDGDVLTIYLLKNFTESIVFNDNFKMIKSEKGVMTIYDKLINKVIINGNGHLLGCVDLNGATGLTLKNIKFDAANASICYDGSGNAKQWALIFSSGDQKPAKGAWNITIENCTFEGTFAKGGASIAFTDQSRSTGASGNITIRGCTFDTNGAYYDIYGHYCGNGTNGYGDFVIENNTFKTEFTQGGPIYLGRYASSTPVVVSGNTFMSTGSLEDSMFVQDHSNYGVSINASNNTFAS